MMAQAPQSAWAKEEALALLLAVIDIVNSMFTAESQWSFTVAVRDCAGRREFPEEEDGDDDTADAMSLPIGLAQGTQFLADIFYDPHSGVLVLPYRCVNLLGDNAIPRYWNYPTMRELLSAWGVAGGTDYTRAAPALLTRSTPRQGRPRPRIQDVQPAWEEHAGPPPQVPAQLGLDTHAPIRDVQPGAGGAVPVAALAVPTQTSTETLISRIWAQWGLDMFMKWSNKKGHTSDGYLILESALRQHASPEWFKDCDLRGFFPVVHFRTSSTAWDTAFSHHFPKKDFRRPNHYQHYPDCEYWVEWTSKVLDVFNTATVEEIRQGLKTHFDTLRWAPDAKSDRLYKQVKVGQSGFSNDVRTLPTNMTGTTGPLIVINLNKVQVSDFQCAAATGERVQALQADALDLEQLHL
jgi:hypothetical protein